jgi:maleate isomerase
MWRSDGRDARVRIGVLTPHADVGPDSELQAMAPDGVRIHAAHVPFGAMGAGGAMDPTIPLEPMAASVEFGLLGDVEAPRTLTSEADRRWLTRLIRNIVFGQDVPDAR